MKHEILLNENLSGDSFYYRKKFAMKDKAQGKKDTLPREPLPFNAKKEEIQVLQALTGILESNALKKYIDDLLPGTFAIRGVFTLTSPYFSRDDDDFYFTANPILKEKITKFPMIRGSAWKGILSATACRLIQEKLKDESISISAVIKDYRSCLRIFGTGSDDFRKLEQAIWQGMESKDKQKMERELLVYCVSELGIDVRLKRNGERLLDQLCRLIFDQKPEELALIKPRKGRGIFYPTYFNQIGYEVINPHSRKKRAGVNPIFFETTPKGSKGIFQFIYIPYDGILLGRKRLASEVKEDEDFLCNALKRCLESSGIGAKSKLGWGLGTWDDGLKVVEGRSV